MQAAAYIVIDGTSDLEFDYAIPDEMKKNIAVGSRVEVRLRNRPATGTVLEIKEVDDSELSFTLKPISRLLGSKPTLTPALLELAHWLSDYYLTPLETVIRAMIPQAAREGEGGEKTRKVVRLIKTPNEEELVKLKKRARRQADAIDYLATQKPEPVMPLAELVNSMNISRPSIKALEDRGWVKIETETVNRDPYGDEEFLFSPPLELNPEQQVALDAVLAAEKNSKRKPILLSGVTGSGKTEVYLQAIQHCIDQGKGAIVLVPEISLTPQTAERFKRRFAAIQDQVAILHSHLSAGERLDEWRKVLSRKARIVIGARSAIFAPVDSLGIIIVDEEHENSYKQESPPRYHARDLAVVRSRIEDCPVVLGSATPSLESWNNALSGKYDLVKMLKRVDDRSLPLIRVIDLRMESRRRGANTGPAILSLKLRQAIEDRLEKDEQTILFLNRRGFSRSLLCPECGKVVECKHCSLPMTFHRSDDRLNCHVCGFARIVPKRCPDCNARAISLVGYGTEKVEEVLKKVFTEAKIARVDTDTMKRKNQLRDTLNAFKSRKTDILIGTQMIAKGLHFPNVTLVGILNADIGLHVADFRAGERTFQLLTQVSGRAGRGEREGEVVVQTFTPHHPSIAYARHHDFEGYAEQELEFRKQFHFPPYPHMVMIAVRSKHMERAEFSLKNLHLRLKKALPESNPDQITISEPVPSPLVRSHDQFRYQISLRANSARKMTALIRSVLKDMTFPEDVIVTIDVDPYSLG
ncbi:MAG: primosomal protein N' [Verrucomicrobia bacterium]|nr:primosomal protein N' [Verrucomicrobiota bacterium]